MSSSVTLVRNASLDATAAFDRECVCILGKLWGGDTIRVLGRDVNCTRGGKLKVEGGMHDDGEARVLWSAV